MITRGEGGDQQVESSGASLQSWSATGSGVSRCVDSSESPGELLTRRGLAGTGGLAATEIDVHQ